MQTLQLSTRQRLREYSLLMRMDKPIGTLLLLWPTLWALWIAAEGMPDPLVFVVFAGGVFLMRSAGCVINDFADRNIDGQVERTKNRPLAQKRISSKEAVLLAAGLALVAFALVLSMNTLTIMMSVVAVILAGTYPFMKRHTHLPQVHLGAAFAWSIPMAFAAQTGSVPMVAWLLFIITVLWTTAYDTMYAMVDREDDLKIGVKSTAILFGNADRVIIALLQTLVLVGFVLVGSALAMGPAYYIGIAVAGGLVVYQLYLIKQRENSRCFRAFLNNNWLGTAVFAGIFTHYLFS
jgi:4-hydroxybenzoate polyprenyltransferase